MRKLLLTAVLLATASVGWGKPLYSVGKLDLYIPGAETSAAYIIDFVRDPEGKQGHLVGIETPILRWDKHWILTAGGATNVESDGESTRGVVFGGLGYTFNLLLKQLSIGYALGRDFDAGKWISGVKANWVLWEFGGE